MTRLAQFSTATLICMLAGAAPAGAFDPAEYHQAQCTRCHDSTVYTRPEHQIKSYDGLESRVARCDLNLALNLPDAELSQLVDYLNTNYYKFQK
jgi:hypothetical protein